MAVSRKVSAATGLCLLGLAVLVVVSPTVEERIPMGAAVARLGNDYLLVAVVAALALVAVLGVLLLRTLTGVAEATPPAVEGTTPGAAGREVDAALDALPPVRVSERHRRVRERVRTAAVETVAEAQRCSRPAARERIESGDWTDDADAAAFLADETLDPPGVGRRVALRLRRENWFRRRVDATVTALEALEGGAT